MCSNGDCFVVLPPNCAENTIILGRNTQDSSALGEAQEVIYYDANEAIDGKCDGGAEPELSEERLRIIVQKPSTGTWGADCGANERKVCVAVSWSVNEPENGSGLLRASDVVRLILATASSANAAIDLIGKLLQAHGSDEAKFNFVICDTKEAWIVSCGGKLMVAQRISGGQRKIPGTGLAITVGDFDKESEKVREKLQALGHWNGSDTLNFAACFGAEYAVTDETWCGVNPVGDGSYMLTSMFETLRAAASAEFSRSAAVFVLNGAGIANHWFTGTPNAMESVFKPFIFAPNARISPLTQATASNGVTLLHKLHAQRKSTALEDLKTLESSCVAEVSKYLEEHPVADEELDELMKDCVEAEVKFYR